MSGLISGSEHVNRRQRDFSSITGLSQLLLKLKCCIEVQHGKTAALRALTELSLFKSNPGVFPAQLVLLREMNIAIALRRRSE